MSGEKVSRSRFAIVLGDLPHSFHNESVGFGAVRFHGRPASPVQLLPPIFLRLHGYLFLHYTQRVREIPCRAERESDP